MLDQLSLRNRRAATAAAGVLVPAPWEPTPLRTPPLTGLPAGGCPYDFGQAVWVPVGVTAVRHVSVTDTLQI